MVINQFHAIGDILFCEPIFRYYWKKNGIKPIVPVRDHLMWLAEAIESADFRPMSKFQLDYDSMIISNPDYLPLRFANQILRGLDANDHSDFENCMLDKYRLVAYIELGGDLENMYELNMFKDKKGLDAFLNALLKDGVKDNFGNEKTLPNWTDIKLNFNWNKGQHLMQLHKTLFMNDQYVLVNNYCQAGEIKIKPESTLPVHYMTEIPGYSVLDWCTMISSTKEFHSVSTSTFFVMQALLNELGAAETPTLHLYPRPNEDGLRGVKNLIPEAGFDIVIHE